MHDYARDVEEARDRMEGAGVRANVAGAGAALATGGVMAAGAHSVLKGMEARQRKAFESKDPSKIDIRRWRTSKDGKLKYVSPLGAHHVVGGGVLALGAGVGMSNYLKRRQQEKEDKALREKYASYDRDILEEEIARRRRGIRGPQPNLRASANDSIPKDIFLRVGVPALAAAGGYHLTGKANSPAGAAAMLALSTGGSILGHSLAEHRSHKRSLRRLRDIEGVNNLSDRELIDTHKRMISRRR